MRVLQVSISVLLSFVLLSFISEDCKTMHEGKFKYFADDEEIMVTIKDSTLTEYHSGGKYTVTTRLQWVNECEYNITVLQVNVPKFPFSAGDGMNVKINRVAGDSIFYTATVGRVSWEGNFIKIHE